MTHRTILHCPRPTAEERALILARIPGSFAEAEGFCRIDHTAPASPEVLRELREVLPFDLNTLPPRIDPAAIRLIVSDMDSTLITIECIDELADCLNLKPQVAAITEAAMAGELDFAAALRRRVALLKGLPVEALQQVFDQRLRYSPGAEALMAEARAAGIRTAVVSGGFTFFTDRIRAALGLDYALANELAQVDGRLTGTVQGAICGPEEKAGFLVRLREQLGLRPEQCIAIGDGANDLKMLAEAGLGVAYRAKPKVQAAADAVIGRGGLDNVCHFFRVTA